MPTKLDVIRDVVRTHLLHPDVNWDELSRSVGEAASARGDSFVERRFIEEVVADVRVGRIEVKEVFPNGTPSLLKIYELAVERKRLQGGSRVRDDVPNWNNIARRSGMRRLRGRPS